MNLSGARTYGNARRRETARFACTACPWTGARLPGLSACPVCESAVAPAAQVEG